MALVPVGPALATDIAPEKEEEEEEEEEEEDARALLLSHLVDDSHEPMRRNGSLIENQPKQSGGHSRLVSREISRFVIADLLAALLIGLGTFAVISNDAESLAIRHAIDLTSVEAKGIIQPNLPSNLLTARPSDWDSTTPANQPLQEFDLIVKSRILNPTVAPGSDVVRVKIWKPDGTIVYSDQHLLIGQRFTLGADEQNALTSGNPDADVSDLTKPENQYERNQGKLLEVYLPVSQGNTRLLFETYQQYTAITQYQQNVWVSFLPLLVGGIGLLFVAQIPLAYRLAHRVKTSLLEREALTERAAQASERERQRIAQDLHDGVVQKLTAVKLSLGTSARRLQGSGADEGSLAGARATMGDAGAALSDAISDLRTLIVDIAPPNLAADGLANAVANFLEPLERQGIKASLSAEGDLGLSQERTLLLYRVARETIRNAVNYANAQHLTVTITKQAAQITMTIADDGRGFTEGELDQRRTEGHIGLSLLRDLVADAGGHLAVDSRPGEGTTIIAKVDNDA